MLLSQLGLTNDKIKKELASKWSQRKGIKDTDPKKAHRVLYGSTGTYKLFTYDKMNGGTIAHNIVEEAIRQIFIGTNLDGEQQSIYVDENKRAYNYLYTEKGDIIERVLTRCITQKMKELDENTKKIVVMLLNNKTSSFKISDIIGAVGINGYTRFFKEQLKINVQVLKKMKGYDLFIVEKNGRQGVINLKGKTIIPCTYTSVNDQFNEGELEDLKEYNFHKCAFVAINEQGMSIIDFNGREIIPPKSYSFPHYVGSGYFSLQDLQKQDIHNNSALVKIGGDEITPYEYQFFRRHSIKGGRYPGNYFAYYKDSSGDNHYKGVLKNDGTQLIPNLFNDFTFYNQFIRTKLGNKYGAYSYEGKEILPAQYNEISPMDTYLITNTIKIEQKHGEKQYSENHYSLFDMSGKRLTGDKTYKGIYIPKKYKNYILFRGHDGYIYLVNKESPEKIVHTYIEPPYTPFDIMGWYKKRHETLDNEIASLNLKDL